MKTRTETRHRRVPHTVNGDTRWVDEPYTVHVPVPPHDWDRIVLAGVSAVTVLAVSASVVWSTASIGDLLALAVPAFAAYLAAGTFDLAWIACLAVEWLARYDTRKARLPRIAGHIALVVAMAAVTVHGWLTASFEVGLVGAAVSALAKGVWTVVLRHHAKHLDPLTQQWVDQKTAEAGAQLAVASISRQVSRVQGQHAALLAASATDRTEADASTPAPDDAQPDTPDAQAMERDASPDALQVKSLRVNTEPITKTAAILAASSALQPDASPASIALLLAQQGLAVDTAYIRTVLHREKQRAQAAGSEGYL